MLSKFKKSRKILIFSILSFGLTVGIYHAWFIWQDYQTLWQVQADQAKIAAYRQETKVKTTDPQAFLKLGDACMKFWESSGKGIRIANNLQKQTLAWEWLFTKPQVLNEGVSAYTKALQLDPKLTDAQFGLCYALVEQGKASLAIAPCRQAVAQQPPKAKNYLWFGVALSHERQWKEAEANFRKTLELEPKNDDAYYLLGNVLLAQRKDNEAVAAYRRSIELEPNANLTYLRLGDALALQNKPEEAIAAYQKSIQLVPNYPLAYEALGRILTEHKRWDEAIASYRKAIELYPMYVNAYKGLGEVLVEQNKLDEAIATYRKAIIREPKDSDIYYLLGIALMKKKNLPEAIAAFKQAVKIDPKNADALQSLEQATKQLARNPIKKS